MTFDVNNPYFRTKVLTASPEELRMLLIEGALRFLREGRGAMEARNYEKLHESFSNARNIIIELSSSLKREVDPDLCGKLEAIYTYVFRLIVEGSFEKSLAKIDEAIELMDYDRETWRLLLEKLAAERSSAGAGAGAVGAEAVGAAGPGYRPLSITG
ncbi:MAG: flagellar export chaperone FliS [Planctomycetota bacterium]|nr:flagellar export chaperone FliS [Planctomycetota bacterium]